MIDGDLEQMLYCDIEWTGEAIGNIIKNALDHTDTGGKISISWEMPCPLSVINILIIAGVCSHDIEILSKQKYFRKSRDWTWIAISKGDC